jgi:hypothetical protein
MRAFFAISFLAMAALPAAAQWHQPDGSGDPAATTCLVGDKPTGSQVPFKACYTNAQWAELKARYIAIQPDGELMLAADAPPGTVVMGRDGRPLMSVNDPRNVHQQRCTRQYGGSNPATNSPAFVTICNNDMP